MELVGKQVQAMHQHRLVIVVAEAQSIQGLPEQMALIGLQAAPALAVIKTVIAVDQFLAAPIHWEIADQHLDIAVLIHQLLPIVFQIGS